MLNIVKNTVNHADISEIFANFVAQISNIRFF